MNNEEIQWIKDCLPKQLSYSYNKDQYALDLLDHCFEDNTQIQTIKQSKFAGLLNKQAVKKVLSQCGDGKLNKAVLAPSWNENTSYLKLTLGQWGEIAKGKSRWCYNQVSRPEKNLVLQVNFGSEHDLMLYNKLGENGRNWLMGNHHPVNEKLSTLGWIRMDIDLEGNEVLIEEVQNDWLRDVRRLKERLDCTKKGCCENHWVKKQRGRFEAYYDFIKPYFKIWDELLLSAALHFTKCELGITHVWYHTNQSSKHYKMMTHSFPPVSVYKTLPEKFVFSKTKEKPNLITGCTALKKLNRSGKELEFYHLELTK